MMFVESLCSNKIFSIPQKNLDSDLEHLSASIGNSICRKLDYKQRPSCAVHAVCGLVLQRGDYTYRCRGKIFKEIIFLVYLPKAFELFPSLKFSST